VIALSGAVSLASLPVGVLIAVGMLAILELGLDVFAFVDLARRPKNMVALGNKWVWVAIILLVNLLGTILYLVVGRQPAPPPEYPVPAASTAPSATSIADALYGERGDSEPT
jgi:hypothetical protein